MFVTALYVDNSAVLNKHIIVSALTSIINSYRECVRSLLSKLLNYLNINKNNLSRYILDINIQYIIYKM